MERKMSSHAQELRKLLADRLQRPQSSNLGTYRPNGQGSVHEMGRTHNDRRTKAAQHHTPIK